jgi:serine/threonine protein kinase
VDTDRNLLFGVLALQLDLIDRDGFVHACAAWASRKDMPLADVLVALHLMTPDERAQVEQFMQRRLNKHGGVVQATLAEAADSAVRSAVATIGDDELSRSLPPTPSPWLAPPTLAPTSCDHPRYAILRLAGTGGIGRVWLARDARLGREVALKELRPDRADPGFWGRFVREAQVTGQLEHPGIVPVYEVGCRPGDNQPFYTMRFVRGRTLKDAIAAYHARRQRKQAGRLDLRELLGAFVQVCQAVGYAHSRGVLHRDLKPHNVALGDFGEVMVLDWGLAKVNPEAAPAGEGSVALTVRLEAEQDATKTGAVLGTPHYMAPEQADGRPDLMDARTDVYGLGAVLYHLLTGEPPFDGEDTPRVLDRVRHDPPRRPRELAAEAPRPLEAVCLKALAKRREDRYPSARTLAEEVQRFLADEPVSAYRDPLTVRLTRWGRRHRTLVTAGTALLLTATAALAVGLLAVNAAKNETARAKQKTQAALDLVTQEQGRTQEALAAKTAALGRSEQAEQSATRQRRLAVQTVHDVVGDINVRLKDRPAQAPLRKALLGRALAGLKDVADAADAATAIDRDTAAAIGHESVLVYVELGDIFFEIEEGGTAEAKKQYGTALELARQVAEADPASAPAQRDLCLAHERLGDVSQRLGDRNAARQEYEKGLAVRQRLADAEPGNAQAQRDLAASHTKLGDVSMGFGDHKAAREEYGKALAASRKLADADPASARDQRDLAASYVALGNVDLESGDPKAARQEYEKGLDVRRRLADADPASARAQRDLAISHTKLGDVYLRLKDNRAARDAFRKALDICRRLADADPASARAQRDLAMSHSKFGEACQRLGDGQAAEEEFQAALRVRQRLADADPTSAPAQLDLLVSHFKLGDAAQQAGDLKAATGRYEQALDVARRFSKPEVFAQEVFVLEERVRLCRAAEQAVADPALALKQPDKLRLPVLTVAMFALAHRVKQPAKITAAADLLADNAQIAEHLYNAACGYALCVPLADKPEQQELYAARAVALLRQAVARGYKDAAEMSRDTDLAPLRPRDDFQKLVADLAAGAKPKDKKQP